MKKTRNLMTCWFGYLAAVVLFVSFTSPARATTYYLSATGNDASSGLSVGSAWLTPKHNLTCGDVILATASNAYSNGNFGAGSWGTVNCPGGDNVAWLKCVTFDACKILIPASNTQQAGMSPSSSYWGIQGWEVSNLSTASNSLWCFGTFPRLNSVHHIIFANNVANVCPLASFGGGSNGIFGTDYLVIVGNISYRGGTSNTGCGSGIDVFSPVATDAAPGTHIFIAGNLSYASTNPSASNCWDGNGIILDTFDGHTTAGLSPYAQQTVVENNFSLANGGVGIQVEYSSPADYNNPPSGAVYGAVYVRNNTMWGNGLGSYAYGSPDCAEYRVFKASNTYATGNLAVTSQKSCYGAWSANNAYVANVANSTDSVVGNWGYSAWGYDDEMVGSNGFSYGSNTFGVNPQLSNPQTPGAPSCSAYGSAPACMATVISNFAPKLLAAQGYGYQTPSSKSTYDPLFPQWVCNVNLPTGLVTMGCAKSNKGTAGH